eukprot:scaffold3932_cov87-Cyclotella_meneghiniana.AAC.8
MLFLGNPKLMSLAGQSFDKSDDEKDAVQVYFYDEKWEIPAGLALLQFITPANTIANSFAD